jgi:hypothetical protein
MRPKKRKSGIWYISPSSSIQPNAALISGAFGHAKAASCFGNSPLFSASWQERSTRD